MWEATQRWAVTAKPARIFTEFQHQTKTKKGGMGSPAACSGQSRAHRRQRKPVLRGDIA